MQLLRGFERKIQRAQGIGYQGGARNEFRLAKKFLPKNKDIKFIDIGGHEGNYADEILEHYPSSEIHIFEPEPHSSAKLSKKFIAKSNVIVHGKGLSNINGLVPLYQDQPGSTQTSIFKRSTESANLEFNKVVDVNVVRLDDWNSANEIFDFIKIDAEGSELAILQGGSRTVSNARVVQFEYGGTNIDSRTYFLDFWKYFNELNFKIFRMSPSGAYRLNKYRDLDENFRLSNLIAVKAER
jgi:FkbM family methyltransferase